MQPVVSLGDLFVLKHIFEQLILLDHFDPGVQQGALEQLMGFLWLILNYWVESLDCVCAICQQPLFQDFVLQRLLLDLLEVEEVGHEGVSLLGLGQGSQVKLLIVDAGLLPFVLLNEALNWFMVEDWHGQDFVAVGRWFGFFVDFTLFVLICESWVF